MQPDWISAQEAADLLRVSRPRIHQLVKANLLDGAHVGGRLLVHRPSVEIRRRPKDVRRVEIFSRPTLHALRERRDVIGRLVALHGGMNVRLFGSAARGDSRLDSDIDLLVDMEPGRSARDMTELAIDLEEALGRRVDLVVDDGSRAASAIAADALPI
jgi:excisionase family DNA binding protein